MPNNDNDDIQVIQNKLQAEIMTKEKEIIKLEKNYNELESLKYGSRIEEVKAAVYEDDVLIKAAVTTEIFDVQPKSKDDQTLEITDTVRDKRISDIEATVTEE